MKNFSFNFRRGNLLISLRQIYRFIVALMFFVRRSLDGDDNFPFLIGDVRLFNVALIELSIFVRNRSWTRKFYFKLKKTQEKENLEPFKLKKQNSKKHNERKMQKKN